MGLRGFNTAFELTPTEQRILSLMRSGNNYKKIASMLGISHHGASNMAKLASEKQYAAIASASQGRKSGLTSLSKARGSVRMDGTK